MLRKFSKSEISEAATTKIVGGKVMTAKQASTMAILAKMEGPKSFVNITKGIPRKKCMSYQLEQHEKEETTKGRMNADLNPGEEDAYNFYEDNVYAKRRSDSFAEYTAENGASMGGTAFKPVEKEDEDDSSEGSIWKAYDSGKTMDMYQTLQRPGIGLLDTKSTFSSMDGGN